MTTSYQEYLLLSLPIENLYEFSLRNRLAYRHLHQTVYRMQQQGLVNVTKKSVNNGAVREVLVITPRRRRTHE